jgi:hypothetical protein
MAKSARDTASATAATPSAIENQRERWETVASLHTARVTKERVATFWAAQPFDLRLANIDGKTNKA